MAWGGARPNSGPKPGFKVVRPGEPMLAPAEPKRPEPLFSQDSVERILHFFQERAGRASARARTEDWNPYVIRPQLFGPVAQHIAKHHPKLAMDKVGRLAQDNQIAVQAWQAGGLLTNVVSEGLLFMGYPYLSELAQRPEFRLIAEIRAEEMVRKWTRHRGVQDESTKSDKDPPPNDDDKQRAEQKQQTGEKPRTDARNKGIEKKIKELRDFEDHLKVKPWFKDVAAQNDFFGISHLLIDRKGINVDNPQDPELSANIGNGRDKVTEAKFKGVKGWLNGLRTIEPIWVYPTTYNAMNPLISTWYDPQLWYVMGTQIHKSQLLQFIGHPVPDILKPAYAFGGLSMTQMAQPYVDIWLRTRTSVGDIIHAFSVMVLLTNLGTTTMPGGSGGGNGDVLARASLFNMFRDNMGLFVVDKATEDFKNVSAPLGGLDDLQAQSQEHMSSITRIPLVKLTGIQPKGLNATSEGELRAFEDTVTGMQEHLFRAKLTSIYDFMHYSLWGERDEDITWDFVPLREETPKEKAEIRKLEAETNQILIDSGQVSQEEARRKIATDPDSGFEGIDPDDVPDLLEEELAGLIPEGSGKGLEAELAQGEPLPANQNQPPRKPKPKAAGEDDSPTPKEARRHAIVTAGGQDEPSMSKTDAEYVRKWPDGATQCGVCTMFVQGGRCTLVRGKIAPAGHCKEFDAD